MRLNWVKLRRSGWSLLGASLWVGYALLAGPVADVRAQVVPGPRTDYASSTAPAVIQPPVIPAPAAVPANPPVIGDTHQPDCSVCQPACGPSVCGPAGRVWVRAEYLLWWTKGSSLPPLLTTSPVGTPVADAGILGLPGTQVLFGDSDVNGGARSGGRITLGTWLNQEQTIGIEGNLFALQNKSTRYTINSSQNPIIARPFTDPDGSPNSLLVAYPGVLDGSADITSRSSDLYGAELNLRYNLCCSCCYRVDLLGGYRFLSLRDGLEINETEAPPGARIDLIDSFRTGNHFHGGQVGLMGEFRRGRVYVDVVGKVALGANAKTVDINGRTELIGLPAVPVGFLASQTNIGRHSQTSFAVVPEVGLTLGYELTSSLRAFVGYTFIYWSDVVRAGKQVDLAVNLSQLPQFPPGTPGTLVGPARPAFSFHNEDFWMQGISFGLEFRF